MNFSYLDYAIVLIYLAGSVLFGVITSGKNKDTTDYFLGGKNLKWWAVGFSIVASETSTLTFISIPGLSYKSDLTFLQLIIGYFIGRVLVTIIFIPAYYKGKIVTAYDFLGQRFGLLTRKITSFVFIITRVLASGVRLFATAIPIHIITGLDYTVSIAIIGIFTIIYTYLGGLKAVVSMDVIQLFIYISGAVASMVVIIISLPNGIDDVIFYSTINTVNKFRLFNFDMGTGFINFLTSPYTFLGALLGGTFLTMASHGTDQLLVQRLLGCKSVRDSQKALLLDAVFILIQFAFFLFLGLCLYAYYQGVPFNELKLLADGRVLSSSDEIFPKFIVESLPTGISGLVIASVLASAMGTLSSAISSLASSSYLDFFALRKKKISEEKEIFWSKILTLVWGIVLVGGAMLFRDTKNPVVEIGLSIASFTYGGLLGTFFLGIFFKNVRQIHAIVGFFSGIITMVIVIFTTNIAYTWYTLIGVSATLLVSNLFSLIRNLIIKYK